MRSWCPSLLTTPLVELAYRGDHHKALCRFITSSDFLYKPNSPGEGLTSAAAAARAASRDAKSRVLPAECGDFWNRAAADAAYLTSAACQGTQQMHGLPDEALIAVRVYLHVNGKLPDEINQPL